MCSCCRILPSGNGMAIFVLKSERHCLPAETLRRSGLLTVLLNEVQDGMRDLHVGFQPLQPSWSPQLHIIVPPQLSLWPEGMLEDWMFGKWRLTVGKPPLQGCSFHEALLLSGWAFWRCSCSGVTILLYVTPTNWLLHQDGLRQINFFGLSVPYPGK